MNDYLKAGLALVIMGLIFIFLPILHIAGLLVNLFQYIQQKLSKIEWQH
jgi:hypothetical protein